MDFYMSFSRGSPPLSSSAWPTEPRQRPKLNHIYVPINQLIHHGGVRAPSVGGGGGEAGPGFPRSERMTMTSLAWRRGNERASSIIHPRNKLINGVNEEEQRRQKNHADRPKETFRSQRRRWHPGVHVNRRGARRGLDTGVRAERLRGSRP